jgi:hypothetical protein
VFSQKNKFRDPPNGWIARNLQWRSKKCRLSEWPTSSCETLRSLRSSLAPHFFGGIWWNVDTTWYNHIVPNSFPPPSLGRMSSSCIGIGLTQLIFGTAAVGLSPPVAADSGWSNLPRRCLENKIERNSEHIWLVVEPPLWKIW